MQGVVTAIHSVLTYSYDRGHSPEKRTACDHVTSDPVTMVKIPCDLVTARRNISHTYSTIYGVTMKVAPLRMVFIGVSTS